MRSKYSKERQQTRSALVALANVPSAGQGIIEAERFLKMYKPLRERAQPDPKEQEPIDGVGLPPLRVLEVVEYARRIRSVWDAAVRGRGISAANAALNEILKAGDPVKGEGPAITADLAAGKLTHAPKSHLQQLALELIYSTKSLARCARCQRYFIKEFSRDKTCSLRCSQQHHNERQVANTRNWRERQEKTEKESTRYAKRANRKN
jgi:hypothetical protein